MLLSFSSSQDLLFLVISIAVVWITAFLCWGLFEIARLLRQVNAMVEETRETVSKVDRVARALVSVAEDGVGSISVAAGTVAKLLSLFTRGSKQGTRSKKKRTKNEDEEEES